MFKSGDATLSSNYTPISLLSVLDKLLEKLMVTKLCRFLEMHDILYNYQFGFRKHHSTTLAMIDVVEDIYQHLDNSKIGSRIHGVSKNCAKLLLSELHQISTNFDNFWQKDGKEAKIMRGALIFHLISFASSHYRVKRRCSKLLGYTTLKVKYP